MTTGNNHPAGPPVSWYPLPERRHADTWFLLAWCLLLWPAAFASAVVATFLGVAIYFDDPGGPLFRPLAWIGSAIAYTLFVGLPLSLCARRRRWYIRLVPAVIVAVPVLWIISLVGFWAIPAAATIAVSIMAETADWRRRLATRAWRLLSNPTERH